MEPERNEVYERIPWETLEEKKSDRQWMTLAIAGAIVLGALAYSFMSNRPPAIAVATTVPAAPATSGPAPAVAPAPALPPTASTAPLVTAEADLYAVHPERAIDRVTAHAEWFVAEYLTVDGSEEGRAALTALMPAGVPLPAAEEGTRVFVEWVRASTVEETAPLDYRVTVLARSLAARSDEVYQRQAPLELTVEITLVDGTPQVVAPPQVRSASAGPASEMTLGTVPEQVGAAALELAGGTDVIGGVQAPDGGWRVVVLVTTPDGVSRPVSISPPAP